MPVPDRERLAAENLELVERVVLALCRRFGPSVERDDLRSFAMEGLAQAIDRWDPDRGTAFPAYARIRIVGAVYDGVQQSGWFSRRVVRKLAFYRRADDLLKEAGSASQPLDRVEAAFGLSSRLKDQAAAYLTSALVEELSPETADEGEPTDERLARMQYLHQLREEMGKLPEKQRDAIRLYFLEGRRLPEIAERLGCKKSWVSRLIGAGLEQLRLSFSKELK
jgi:RNA polymerase sigma factor for flagellar operon FliA